MKIWRRKRYATAVLSLLTLVFIGVGTVTGILATTVLRPLPFAHSEQFFRSMPFTDNGLDLWELDQMHRVAAYVPEIAELSVMTPLEHQVVEYRGDTISAGVTVTAPNFFRFFGIPTAAYDVPGAAIVSRNLVQRLGLTGANAVGKSIRVGVEQLTIAGVIDRTKALPADGDVWFAADRRGAQWMGLVRMRREITTDALANRMSRAYQTLDQGEKGLVRVMITPLEALARPAMAGAQRMLVAGIGMFTVIAILNFGLLGIGDARRRAQEFAVRVAVGGTRAQVMWGLFRDQLTLVGVASIIAIIAMMPVALRRYDVNELAKSILHLPSEIWLTVGAALALLVLAAGLPTRVSTNTPEMEVLRRVGARASRVEAIWNRAFVSVQFGFTAFLVVVGTVTLLGVLRDKQPRYGYDEKDATIGRVSFTDARSKSAAGLSVTREFARLVERTFPNEATVWATGGRAMSGGKYLFAIDPGVAPATRVIPGPRMIPWLAYDVAPNFFDVVGIRIVKGRGFRDTDDANGQPVVIVAEKAARNLWGTTDVGGNRMRFGEDDGTWRTVVGVAADAYPIMQMSFDSQARGAKWPLAFVYQPLAQIGNESGFTVLVRHHDVASVNAVLPGLLERIAPGEKFYPQSISSPFLRLTQFLDYRGQVEAGESTSRALFIFAACGLVLGLLGAMILIDDVVRGRTTELGIRRALGASAANLVALASRETVLAGTAGILGGGLVGARFGPVVAVWLKGRLSTVPSGISWPLAAGIAAGLFLILIGGTTLRAWRAARLDPAAALRAS